MARITEKSGHSTKQRQYSQHRGRRWLSESLQSLRQTSQQTPFDIAIVGSGYGGAIAAAELSNQTIVENGQRRHLRVCVLERGREFLPGSFPKEMAELPTEVRYRQMSSEKLTGSAQGLYDIRAGDDVGVLLGNGLGGGSLINAGIMESPTDDIFDQHWPETIRNMPIKQRRQLFAETKQMLGASLNDQIDNTINNHQIHRKNSLHKFSALKQLAGHNPFRPATITVAMSNRPSSGKVNLKRCKLCSDCATGCNHGAKESLDTNLLHKAWCNGVAIYTGVTVLNIDKHDDDWLLNIVDTNHKSRRKEAANNQRKSAIFQLHVKRIILAAGSLGSTEILLRSRKNISLDNPNIGKRFSSNGDMLAAGCDMSVDVNAIGDETIMPDSRLVGPTCTGVIDLRTGKKLGGHVIEELAVPGPLKRLYSELFVTANTLHEFGKADLSSHSYGQPDNDPFAVTTERTERLSIYAIMSDDGAGGVMKLNTDEPSFMQDGIINIEWKYLKDNPVFKQQIKTLKQLNRQASLGGRIIGNPGWAPVPETMSFLFNNDKGPLFTVHPLGGCSMANSIETGVVDHIGRIFNNSEQPTSTFDNLIILDGAIIPTAVGINPALTIAAISLQAIRQLKEFWQLSGMQNEPFKQTDPVDRPFFRDCSGAVIKQETTIEIAERLAGNIEIKDNKGKYQKKRLELTLYFEEFSLQKLLSHPYKLKTKRNISLSSSKPSTLTIYSHTENNTPDKAEFSATLSGHLQIFHRNRNSPLSRISRSGRAWLLNRGLRDIFQGVFPKQWEKPSKQDKQKGSRKTQIWGRILNTIRLASRAGECRLFDYQLIATHEDSAKTHVDYQQLTREFHFNAVKRISYTRRSNPWKQLMQVELSALPSCIKSSPHPKLELDLDFLADIKTPLLRINEQNDQVNALADIASLASYMTRMLLSIHIWSFPKPDTWQPRTAERLPGPLEGVDKNPDIIYLPVIEGIKACIYHDEASCRLTRYQHKTSTKLPVMLIHGYSTSGTTFSHPHIKNNLVTQLVHDGRTVWVLDLRTSIGMQKTCLKPWTFEEVAYTDIPLALDYIHEHSGQIPVHVLAHCVGGAMFSMALLGENHDAKETINRLTGNSSIDEFYKNRVASIALSQVGPYIRFTAENRFRAYLTNYFLSVFEQQKYTFRPTDKDDMKSQILDRLLSSLPYPESEFDREYPGHPPWKRSAFTGLRHRMDLLYGRTFNLNNIDDNLLEVIDDIFGAPNIKTVSQAIHFARHQVITNQRGFNEFVSLKSLHKKWQYPTCLIHGKENGLADVKTIFLLEEKLKAAGCPINEAIPIDNAGHQDCYIGKAVTVTGEKLLQHLHQAEIYIDGPTHPANNMKHSYSIETPASGPIWSPPIQTAGKLHFRISMGVRANLVKPLMFLPVPVKIAGDSTIITMPDSETYLIECYQHFFSQKKYTAEYLEGSYWFHIDFQIPEPDADCTSLLCLLVYENYVERKSTIDKGLEFAQQIRRAILERSSVDLAEGMIHYKRKIIQNDSLCFALGSCQYPAGPLDEIPAYLAWNQLGERLENDHDNRTKPELLLLAGDQVYTDASAGICDPTTGHDRFMIPYYQWLENREVRRVFRYLPAYMMLDDHEITDNWEPGITVDKYRNDLNAGIQSYLAFQRGHRFALKNNPGESLSDLFTFRGFEFFMLDSRTGREKRSSDTYITAHIINQEQQLQLTKWFKTITQNDNGKPKFLLCPSMPFPRPVEVSGDENCTDQIDSWNGYPASMDFLLGLITDYRPENLVILSGDEHISNVATIDIRGAGIDDHIRIFAIHSSGLYSPFPFANAKKADFCATETFNFYQKDKQYSCSINADFYPGSGFAVIETAKSNSGKWNFTIEFLRTGRAKTGMAESS
ncbi:MAG: alkaline phosphatase D family protein [Gammaproteobacteria bacterium]